MTKLDPNAVALRYKPNVRQEVLQGPDGRFCGFVEGAVEWWYEDGTYSRTNPDSQLDLVPLQTRPTIAHFWAIYGGNGWVQCQPGTEGAVEMVQRDLAEAMARAVERIEGLYLTQKTRDAVDAYRAAYPEVGHE